MIAKELRIGNIVLIKLPHNKDFTVIEIKSGDDINSCLRNPICFKFIPITEEWLLKLGFISNPYQDRYEKGDIDVECDKTKKETILWLSGTPHIKYVHQLQNLYFALTGNELKSM